MPRLTAIRLAPWVLIAVAVGGAAVAMSADKRTTDDRQTPDDRQKPDDRQTRSTSGPVTQSPPQGAASAAAVAPAPTSFFGVTTPSGPYNLAEVDVFEAVAGKKPAVVMFSQDWAHARFRPELLNSIADRSSVPTLPLITWEPRDHTVGDLAHGVPATDQPQYSLSRIIDGSWDGYIREWATGIRAWGRPVGIRFAQQMNGNWFPWSEGVNGNQPGQYVEAWRHVRRIFDEVGTPNVIWVWSANVSYVGSAPLAPLYPGDAYVDWVGIDGYNGGAALGWGGWVSPDALFGPTITEIRAFTDKPLVLTEVASTEVGGSKAEWIEHFFDMLRGHTEIMGFIWVEADREADWRIVSSQPAAAAFSAGVAEDRFSHAPAAPR